MSMDDDKRVSILIVEDNPIYREALEGNLQTRPDLFEIVGLADCREQALLKVEQHVPDIVVLDLVLQRNRWAGIDAIREIRQLSPATRVVVLTAHFDDDLIFNAIRAGADTYLVKDRVLSDELARILLLVQAGNPPLDTEIARLLYRFFQSPGNNPDQENDTFRLTGREIEVLKLVAEGKRNREIAEILVIAEKTVKTHVSNILSKLHLSNRTELMWWYKRQQYGKNAKFNSPETD